MDSIKPVRTRGDKEAYMGYGLANIDGRAAFIDGDDFYDVARLSEGPSDNRATS